MLTITVVLSYTAALNYLAEGTLADNDLNSAIFCLSGPPDWPFRETKFLLGAQQPYQRAIISSENIESLRSHIKMANEFGRVMWRDNKSEPSEVFTQLNSILERYGFRPMDECPPGIGNGELQTAIERANNKNGIKRVRIITT